jgi:hypothetical protein
MRGTLPHVLALAALLPPSAAAAAPTARPLDPADFVGRVTNPWYPLTPGSTYVYRGVKDGRASREVITVRQQTKVISGVRTTVVSDVLYVDGRLAERTTDWYAQDKKGSVWYFGERTAELDRTGRVTSREGSWQTGLNGAKPGIYMPARPRAGQSFRQEIYKGHAEDRFRILSLAVSVHVPFVSSDKALLTKEWTPLEPGVVDHKYYVRGIGTVKELSVKGAAESAVLVSMKSG